MCSSVFFVFCPLSQPIVKESPGDFTVLEISRVLQQWRSYFAQNFIDEKLAITLRST
jgi:hypothetical protein